jgi:zinc transport system substrate-binding protein
MIDRRKLPLVLVLLIAACGGDDRQPATVDAAATNPASTLVIASNYPLYYFASRITEGVESAPEIVFPDIDGDPAFWTPGAEQIQLLQSADVILLNGAGAESWLSQVTLDRARLVDTLAGIADRLIPLDDSVQHQHGPEGEHSHQGTAFTTWLDPQLAAAQANALVETLIELAPMLETQFRANLASLEQDLNELDARLADVFTRLGDRPVLFSHPVYQYLERRYGINGESLHWEPDEAPSTTDWIALTQLISSHPATIMLWEDEPLGETEARLSGSGIASVPFQTAANRPEEGDYLGVMRANAARLEQAL